jgi:hypothetical protein
MVVVNKESVISKVKESFSDTLIIWLILAMFLIAIMEWWSLAVMVHLLIAAIIFGFVAMKKIPCVSILFIILEAIVFLLGFSTKTALIIILLLLPCWIVIFLLKNYSKLYSN